MTARPSTRVCCRRLPNERVNEEKSGTRWMEVGIPGAKVCHWYTGSYLRERSTSGASCPATRPHCPPSGRRPGRSMARRPGAVGPSLSGSSSLGRDERRALVDFPSAGMNSSSASQAKRKRSCARCEGWNFARGRAEEAGNLLRVEEQPQRIDPHPRLLDARIASIQ